MYAIRSYYAGAAWAGLGFGAPSAPDVATLLRPADVTSVVLSPDGRHLAMIRSDADKDTLVIFQRPSMAIATGVSSRPGERFATITWANSSRLLIEPAA